VQFLSKSRVVPRVVRFVQEVQPAIDMMQMAILLFSHQNCAARMALLPRTVLWWNKELSSLTTSTRWQCNQAKRIGNWQSYKTAVTCYNEQIRKTTQLSWRDYCCGIKDVSERFRLMRGMASQLVNMVGSIKLLMADIHNWKRRP